MRRFLPLAAGFALVPSTAFALDISTGAALPGQPFTITVSDAPVNAPVFVLLSTTGVGPGPCHPTAPICAGIRAPQVIAQGRANGAGQRVVTLTLPGNLPVGYTFHLQAAWASGGLGEVSAPLTVTTTGACAPYQESYSPLAGEYLIADEYTDLAQTVTPVQDFTLETVTLPLWNCTPNGTPDAQIQILGTDASGYPDDANVLAISDVIPNSALYDTCFGGQPGVPVTFTLASPLAMAAGTTYAIQLLSIGSPGGWVAWTRSSIPQDPYDPYAGGTYFERYGFFFPPEWMPGNGALDLAFQLQGCD